MATWAGAYSGSDQYTWITVEGDIATVGFTDYSCERMEEMVALEFKEPGESVRQSDPIGTVDVMKKLIDIPAPVSVVVVEVNPKVVEDLELSKSDKFGQG